MDFNLKHRIAGAAILIAMGVLVAAIVLDEPDPPPADVARGPISGSADDTRTFVSRVTPIGGRLEPRTPADAEAPSRWESSEQTSAGTAEAPGAGVDDPADAPSPSLAPVANAPADDEQPEHEASDTGGQSARATAEATDPEPGEAQTRVAAAEPSGAGAAGEQVEDAGTSLPTPSEEPQRGWVVRIGTYAQPGNVERLEARLREVGFEARTSDAVTDAGQATRVWVGPYEKRVDAARVRARIEELTGQKGLITAYP